MDARQRKHKQKKIAKARERARVVERARAVAKRPTAKASDYISPLTVNPGDVFVRCARCSTRSQRQHLTEQLTVLEQEVLKRGGVIYTPPSLPVGHVGNGSDPSWLTPYAEIAKEHGYSLLAESTDRFIRSGDYHPHNNPHARPSKSDFIRLRRATLGVALVTLIHPDAAFREVRRHQTRRGQIAKGKTGGRPVRELAGYKKQRREELLPEALELKAQGTSIKKISKELGVAYMTACDWLKEEK